VVPDATSMLPAILFAVWLCGFAAVAVSWRTRWRRMRAAVRAATPLAVEAGVPVLSSRALIEPGAFGIFRPVLLLPEGIVDHLAPAQLQAILAHELCHVRRRDNLAGALHMAVETIFWFHPLVWWLGTRLVEERERACDEEVLRLGNAPEVYAEGILKTCRYYLESPLVCAAGVTGSDLKERIARILNGRRAHRLALEKKLLLAAAAMTAVVGPIGFGLMNAPAGRAQSQVEAAPAETFEVASIKPNKSGERNVRMMNSPGRFRATNVSLKMLIRMAYGVQDFQITGGPGWMNSDTYDVEAKEPGRADAVSPMNMDENQRKADEERRKRMVQALLADRFQLKLHRETKDLPVYALVVAKNGPKLKESEIPADAKGPGPGGKFRGMMMGPGQLSGDGATLEFLATALSNTLGRPVLDQTGLKGLYDFKLQWTPDEGQRRMMMVMKGGPGAGSGDAPPPPDASGPSVFTAIQEQLGLKLESKKGPVEILVIDHAEQPSEN
ncbi:MAG: M56 and DUF3738 domain-containing protein, partial [Acidobacteria bacterium]|nr:M56 and DUF3738 domain-containing protein [Acidobacteriota bacterium]